MEENADTKQKQLTLLIDQYGCEFALDNMRIQLVADSANKVGKILFKDA